METDKTLVIIGIDPGKNTGVAAYSTKTKSLIMCETCSIIEAMETIKDFMADDKLSIEIVYEDAKKRRWFGKSGREKLQGAGSIKRDCTIWEEFAKYHQIPCTGVAPSAGSTKMNKDTFARITGWIGRTSVHARDSALLVIGSR